MVTPQAAAAGWGRGSDEPIAATPVSLTPGGPAGAPGREAAGAMRRPVSKTPLISVASPHVRGGGIAVDGRLTAAAPAVGGSSLPPRPSGPGRRLRRHLGAPGRPKRDGPLAVQRRSWQGAMRVGGVDVRRRPAKGAIVRIRRCSATDPSSENPLVRVVRPFPPEARDAMYRASTAGALRRGMWYGCVLNRAGLELGRDVSDSAEAADALGTRPGVVRRFLRTWDMLSGTDPQCTQLLRAALEEVRLSAEPGSALAESASPAGRQVGPPGARSRPRPATGDVVRVHSGRRAGRRDRRSLLARPARPSRNGARRHTM